MIDKLGRQRTKELLATGDSVDFELREPGVDGIDLEEISRETKARRYALFAHLIDKLIDKAEEERGDSPDGTFPPSPYIDVRRNLDDYEKLRLNYLNVFIDIAVSLEDTPECQQLGGLAELREDLGIDGGYIYPVGQLTAGCDTAVSTMLMLLKNIPPVLSHYLPEQYLSGADITEIAHNSVGLPWNISMISIDQMMALQTITTGNIKHTGWSDFDIAIDPNYFTVITDDIGRAKSIKFTDIGGVVVWAGYQYMEDDPFLEAPTELRNYGASNDTIGCPITFLPRKMHKLWDWMIEDVSSAGLWDSPAGSANIS